VRIKYGMSHKRRVLACTEKTVLRPNMVSVLESYAAAKAKHSDYRPVWGMFKFGWGGTVDRISCKLKTWQTKRKGIESEP
jgi:hypothetical protein